MKSFIVFTSLLITTLLVLDYTNSAAIPIETHNEKETKEETKPEEGGDDWEMNLEYGRYLKEIVQALESDPEFRKKLETADVEDIKSGQIARELHFVDHGIRSKLDELKRQELERLRHLAVQEYEKQNGVDRQRMKIPVHIDLRTPNRFEVEDLRKLIIKTTKDLEEADRQRRDDFKTYEMEKDFQYNQSLKALNDTSRQVLSQKHDEEKKKHAQHPKLHHPVSKQQLEEVWEDQDHMDANDFDPKLFFKFHDLDNNGQWDQVEVKALFQKELDKLYDPNNPEDDINERIEEMERMREHVFRESDKDRDGLISFEEFLEQSKKPDFEQDEGWQGLDENEVFSQREYEEYERQRQMEMNRLVQEGKVESHDNVQRLPQPISGNEAAPHPGNPGIPLNAVPQVSQHLDAAQQQEHPKVNAPQINVIQNVPGQH